ncbi:MAG: hypothetical protein JO360_10480, partial [Acidobacteria bacterium]|nr:hypothetical protein [Acidobacteriota bacterium]
LISNWVETVKPLARLFMHNLETEMELALQRACRRLELLSRRKHDEQQLKYFLNRREQDEALESLMNEGPEHWALHYVGAGGMGKTMMMRHITVNLASNWNAAVARIDFDYLNADYPKRAPGLLLWSLAQELRAYDEKGRANKIFDKADDLLRKLHQRLVSERGRRVRPGFNDPIFADALNLYIDACHALSRRIVLILDTCEELSRVRPDNREPENVEATFAILTALQSGYHGKAKLHSQAPQSMRVIFSGRRLLARRGYKWHAPASTLAERSFLRLHEIRGFTHPEAQTFLRDKLHVSKALIEPIIERTPDESRVVDVVWETESDRPPDVPRCNPYELKLFGDWATDIPPPTAEQIKKASIAQYIETRIVQRLKDDLLERMLPILTLLGHCDRELFRAVAAATDQTSDTTFDILQQQEWINPRLVTTGSGDQTRLILDMESGLRARLLSHYRHGRCCPSDTLSRAADYLEKTTLEEALSNLDWSTFDAAIRILELDADPLRVARWWSQVEARIVRERGFESVIELIGLIQGKDGAVCKRDYATGGEGSSENRLRPSVLATYASALLNTGRGGETSEVWREVYSAALPLSDSASNFELRIRGLAGLVTAARVADSLLPDDLYLLERELHGLVCGIDARAKILPLLEENPQLAAALVAASETIIEQAEQSFAAHPDKARAIRQDRKFQSEQIFEAVHFIDLPARLLEFIKELRQGWHKQWPKRAQAQEQALAFIDLHAFAASLAARASVMDRDYLKARDYFDEALTLVRTVKPRKKRAVWADWLPPEDLSARIRLEFVRGLYPAGLYAERALETIQEWLRGTPNIDSDRFSSAMYRLHMTLGPLSMSQFKRVLDGWGISDFNSLSASKTETIAAGIPVCNAHRSTPPLFATLAEAMATVGYVYPALEFLSQIVSQSRRFGLELTREAERPHLRIAQRMRLREVGDFSGRGLRESSELEDHKLLWMLEAMEGRSNPQWFPALPPDAGELERYAWLHAIWQTRFARDRERIREVRQWAREHLPVFTSAPSPSSDLLLEAALELDVLEAQQLLDANLHSPDLRLKQLERELSGAGWNAKYDDRPTETLRLLLRCIALKRIPSAEVNRMIDELVQRLGPRRAAEIAFEEGDLLTLRLPESALSIWLRALSWFEQSQDQVGTLIAGIFASLIYGRTSQQVELQRTLERVRPAYQKVSTLWDTLGMNAMLPTWARLRKFAGTPDPKLLGEGWPRYWQPLLMRLVIALSCQDDGLQSLKLGTPLFEWIRTSIGKPYGRGVAFPSDIDELMYAGLPAQESVRNVKEAEEENRGLCLNLSPLEHINPALGVRSRLTIPAVNIALTSDNSREPTVYWEGRVKGFDLTTYRSMSKALPEDFRKIIEQLRSNNGSALLDITLKPGPELQGPCWEAMFAFNLQGKAFSPQTLPMHLHRTSYNQAARPPLAMPAQKEPLRIVTPTASHVGRSIAERGWAELTKSSRFVLEVTPPLRPIATPELNEVRILHLVGAAEENFSSVWFNMSPDISSHKIRGGLDETYYTKTAGGGANWDDDEESYHISSEDLGRILPNLLLCIIQGVTENVFKRTITDRRDAILARIFAADLSATGVPIVLVLPPLTPDLSVQVLKTLSRAMKRLLLKEFTSFPALLADTIKAIQIQIIKGVREAESGQELALDVCCYMEPNRRNT